MPLSTPPTMSEGFAFDGSAEVIAHRGYSSRAPENTLAAIDLAIEAGADAIEFDVHTAGDGNPVLFHDPMLGRTTNGVGPVRRRTIEQLKNLDAPTPSAYRNHFRTPNRMKRSK